MQFLSTVFVIITTSIAVTVEYIIIVLKIKSPVALYYAAINLMCDKFGLPDFAYQAKVVSREQKNNTKSIIRDIAEGMIEQSRRTEPLTR